MSYVENLIEARQKAWHQAKELLDTAAAEKRELTAEEEQSFQRINADLDRRAAMIDDINKAMEREERVNEAVRGIETAVRPSESVGGDDDLLRALARGEIRSAMFEKRALSPATTSAPVKVSVFDRIIEQARLVGPMLTTSTILNTTSGENLTIPALSTWSTATIATATAAIGTSDPAFSSVTLSAYKLSFIVQVARELLTDSAVDISGFIATEAGNAIGYAANTSLTTGAGTGGTTIKGIVTAATNGGTSSSTATITADDLIDLAYGLDGAARLMPGTGWQMNGKTLGVVRKLKASTSGEYLFTPTLDAATPDRLLGWPVFENPAVADLAAASKSVLFGHLPSYMVRIAGGIALDRSDDYGFANDVATFRATMRVDGNLPQATHVRYLVSKS